jgi:hypothetical protein
MNAQKTVRATERRNIRNRKNATRKMAHKNGHKQSSMLDQPTDRPTCAVLMTADAKDTSISIWSMASSSNGPAILFFFLFRRFAMDGNL